MDAESISADTEVLMNIQPEVIIMEDDGNDPVMSSVVDNPRKSDLSAKIGTSRMQMQNKTSMTPLPRLNWSIGVQLEKLDENGQTVEEGIGEDEGEDLGADVDMEIMDLGEEEDCEEIKQRKLPYKPKSKFPKKRGRKGLPRKATMTPTELSRQLNDNYQPNFEVEEVENPNLFQVALKMTMRGSEQRKGRSAFISPMPVIKRASLSLQDKINIIEELTTGEKQSTICRKQGLPKSTVQSIWKNREKIQGAVQKIGLNRKRCRKAQHEDVEDKLVEWINNLKAQSVPVNGPQLRAKAQVMAKQMGLTEFRCSTGWLDKFKTRHRIIFKKAKTSPKNMIAGDRKVAMDWVTKVWPALCDGYPPSDIFNVDEAGIFFRAPPDKAHRLKGETCHGGKMSKERITVLLCANSEGTEKLKISAVGNITHPRSFEMISNLDNLPAFWNYNARSWMTRDIFLTWLRNWDELLRSIDRQIILILDNSPAHETREEQFTNIKLVYLPSVVSTILQPLEQGVKSRFKLHYRRLLLDRMVRKAELGVSRTISILEALTMLSTAWTEVSPDLIADSFKTSNLQSHMVPPDMGSGSANDLEEFLADEPRLLQQAIRVGIPIPDNVSFKEYCLIDSSLHVTDYINDSTSPPTEQGSSSGEAEVVEEEFVQPIEVPLQREVQGFIDAIRNWAMMSTLHCDSNIHTALSVLESFTLKAKPPGISAPATTITAVGVGVNLNNEQDIPVSVIVSSRNGTNEENTALTGDNLTLTTFDASQQMVQIPISIHSQSTELVTLTALEPSPPQELDGLELERHDRSSNDNSSVHSQDANIQAMHFQHHPQFFAYLG